MERTITFAGDPNIGVFARVLGDIAIVPPESPEEFKSAVRDALNVTLVETTIQGSSIIGSLVAGNSRGVVVSGLATEEEVDRLAEHREVLLLTESMNAAGNVIMANDTFAAVHQDMPTELSQVIGEFLEVEVIHLTLGGVKTVGMAGVATNKGVIVHPRATERQISQLEEVAKVPVGTGSVNMGGALVGTGLLVNEQGYLAGNATSGFELGRIEDVFGFLE
ncbi:MULTISPECIES: translation initiation factor IF-6 [unclassified Methanoregula]|uniref:translation initiation factor IF-6 n=1 Tax=unclassified Methanoregula TaxID=2649730 RepID=UPI0009D04AB2|nr:MULTISPECIES: translation initiation factor IF-6 [unclassified Methanoregula]OPX64465.1 MAG: Translation initiation factor 6 [Methanoregula sp. PtaB.Bin085]OPY35864.1 MAG: Translation initiation factor 6 [Methanoregula sp. PtaU1.Bin006]